MEIAEALESRRSIRRFLKNPVSKEVISEILCRTVRAPSGKNTQPWEFIVLTGDILREISDANVERLRSNVPAKPDVQVEFPRGIFVARSQEVAKLVYDSLGIHREDKIRRQEWWDFGVRYFDAPTAIIIHFGPDIDPEHAFFDLGTLSQSICLIALEKGLGTCITR